MACRTWYWNCDGCGRRQVTRKGRAPRGWLFEMGARFFRFCSNSCRRTREEVTG